MLDTLFTDTATLMLFTLPVLTAIYSVVAGIIIRDKIITSGIVLITYLALARLFLGKTFLAWAIIYTVLSLCITWLLEILSNNQRREATRERYE